MATYDLQEQESLAELKAWWKQNGSLVLIVIGVVLLAFSAWNGWNWYQRSQAAKAGVLYEQMQSAARANDLKATRDIAGMILQQFPRTTYAPLAALISAKAAYQAGDTNTARAQLQWAAEHTRSDQVKAVARLRLANVLLDANAPDEALKTLEGKPPAGFEALYHSARGDILVTQKKIPEARAAYKAALEPVAATKPVDAKAAKDGKDAKEIRDAAEAAAGNAKGDPMLREVLRLKLDALGESS